MELSFSKIICKEGGITEYQNLIDEVVKEIYKRLEKEFPNSHKKKVVLIGDVNEDEYKVLENKYQIVHFSSDVTDFHSIIICKMPLTMLGNLAVGCSHREEEIFVLKALLSEKPVYMIESGLEYRNYKKTSYKTLYTLYSDYEKKITQYGIESISNISDVLQYEQNNETKHNLRLDRDDTHVGLNRINLSAKKLLLESDLMKSHNSYSDMIELNKKCIVTPLAMDYIKNHNLNIRRV